MVRSVQQIRYADSFLPEEAVFAGGCKEKRIPIVLSFYLLQTDTRTVLVDAGCDDLPGFVMLERCSPVEALHRHGVSPEQVTDIIITHAHHDHIDGVRYFPNACVYLQRDEYAAGKQYLSDRVQVITFAQEQTVDDCLDIVRVGGHSKGSCVVEFDYEGRRCVIAGDECYSTENLIRRIPTATCFDAQKSQAFIDRYASGDYRVYLLH